MPEHGGYLDEASPLHCEIGRAGVSKVMEVEIADMSVFERQSPDRVKTRIRFIMLRRPWK